MPQFLLSLDDLTEKTFSLEGPEAFHITRVLRRREGDTIELFDGKGGKYKGIIRKIHDDGLVEGDITETAQAPKRAYPVTLNLYLSLLKASHWEIALEKCTEIGVSAFYPVITPRTVVQLRELGKNKRERWGKIMTAASKQCGRAGLPKLEEPVHYRDAIIAAGKAKNALTLLAWEKHEGRSTYAGLKDALRQAKRRFEKGMSVNLFVGPEGGFSDEEIKIAEIENAGFFSLGPNTLRAETAAVSASSIILYELGAL